MNIMVIGIGRIGLVTACCLANSGHHVTGIEIDRAKIKLLNSGVSPIREPGIEEMLKAEISSGRLAFSHSLPHRFGVDTIMITVNTPSLKNGSADLSQIYSVLDQVRNIIKEPLVMVMKSTVPPGTGVHIMENYVKGTPVIYVANPEFLRAGQAIYDWYHPSRIVVGTDDKQAVSKVRNLYSDIEAPFLIMSVTSAEMVKYAANTYLATRISFINEIANLCEVLGANIDDVAHGIGLDPRIGTAFLQAGVGYGGSCLPKDTNALDNLASRNGYDFKLLKATIKVNIRQRDLIVHKLKQLIGSLDGKEVAVLGLSFKPGTDDITNSPSLDITTWLIKEGARLRVYDPMAMENVKPLFPDNVAFCSDIYSAITGANAALLITEWPEFTKADWSAIKKLMIEPYAILDGRNVLPWQKLITSGFKYVGVGRVFL